MANPTRVVKLPPNAPPLEDGSLLGGWWHAEGDERIVCDLCPRECHLKQGARGFCFVRQNRDGEMVLTTYGRSTGFCIDPIEKKPLNHFLPGTSVLSFGTAGCNLGCKFCQNHDISKAREVELLSEHAAPDAIARAAAQHGCASVAYTYNDPIIWAEYAIETAKACREHDIRSVAVTAGYISPDARQPFFEYFDAANVDLKAFTETFYEKLTLSHLQPVLDTIEWLKRETDVWFEITNLIIPDANDSPDELKRLCQWVLDHVGDEVPVHFSAFHPDFRMLDRPRTPPDTLLAAYEIARRVGLRYVYVGNVHDAKHQSTYCGSCGKLLIERDWYALGAYHLDHDRCTYCRARIPGHFEDRPGSWGRKREPIQIQDYREATGRLAASRSDSGATTMSPPQTQSAHGLVLNKDQEAAVHQAACRSVVAAVTGQPANSSHGGMGALAQTPVMGVYVSLKRKGRLRGCCGFTGRAMPLQEGIAFSAQRTALEDTRMPPVSPTELPFLDVEVWLLQGLIPVTSKAEDRANAIQVGRDGLLISRGNQRGLLLPGVATDLGLDEAAFLRQVCIKANLPPTAWRDSGTELQRFEGISVRAPFRTDTLGAATDGLTWLNDASLTQLTQWCRQNVQLLVRGAVPNYYATGVQDGMVNGAVLSAYGDEKRFVHVPKISLRPRVPLQATLFQLAETLAGILRRPDWTSSTVRIELTVFDDVAMHGTLHDPDLRGVTPDTRALLLLSGGSSGWRFDPSQTPDTLLLDLKQAIDPKHDQATSLFSLAAKATATPVDSTNRPQPRQQTNARPPAVAGSFYPQRPDALHEMVATLAPPPAQHRRPWRAAMIPHAGLRFSGRIAASVLAQIDIPETIIVLGPKHTRQGVDWAVASHSKWSLPGFHVPSDPKLATELATEIEGLELDDAAHATEHAIEVELPLLHHYAPSARVVGIVMGSGDAKRCQTFADGLAKVLQRRQDRILLLISSDMNHFATDQENRRLDELALQAMETKNPDQLWNTVRDHQISMCGVIPAVTVMRTLARMNGLKEVARAGYATSADVTHDTSRVVGYAGMLLD